MYYLLPLAHPEEMEDKLDTFLPSILKKLRGNIGLGLGLCVRACVMLAYGK